MSVASELVNTNAPDRCDLLQLNHWHRKFAIPRMLCFSLFHLSGNMYCIRLGVAFRRIHAPNAVAGRVNASVSELQRRVFTLLKWVTSHICVIKSVWL